MQEHWNDMNHGFISFKVTKVMMQLRSSVIVVFSVDLECMWVPVFVREELQLSQIRACSVPALWIRFRAAAAAPDPDVGLVEGP